MYCVIQQIRRKKPNPYGEYREIEAYQNQWRIAGDERPCTWSWRYTGGRFERPHQEHRRILDVHSAARNAFAKRYGVDGDEYDRCYDVFGVLRNKEYLAEIKAAHNARKQSERSYRESWRSTYEQYSWGSYSIPSVSTYTEAETAILRQFYRSLSKTYHPDLNPGKDTTAEMQLLNRLKESWGV